MNINLHIDRVILDGLRLDDGQQKVLQATIEYELLSLIKEQGLGSINGGARPSVAADGIQLERGYSSAQLGRQIAQSVYGGLKK
jgi:hypothetical protein